MPLDTGWKRIVTTLNIYKFVLQRPLIALINLVGLAFGISVFSTMALIHNYEYGYDANIPNAKSIYQVEENFYPHGKIHLETDSVSFVTFPFLKQDFPEIRASTWIMQEPLVVRVGDRVEREQITMTNSSYFSIFDLPLVEGDKATALNGPNKVVISFAIAQKYFGHTRALGKRFRIDNAQSDAVVTGVLAKPPPNQSMGFDIVEATPSNWLNKPAFTNWGSEWGTMWVRIDNPDSIPRINRELMRYPHLHPGNFSETAINETMGNGGLKLIPLLDVHFHSAAIGDGGNSRTLITTLDAIGLAALITAIINYVNLATARSSLRAREVAVRKTLGATRLVLIQQFMGEALALVALAALVGLALTELSVRFVNEWGGWHLSFNIGFIAPVTCLTVILTGLGAGFYPALILSSYRPALVFAASKTPSGGRIESSVRTALVVFQFSFAIMLGTCTLMITKQASFVQHLERGLRQDGLLIITSLGDPSLRNQQEAIIARLASVKDVVIATRSDVFPHNELNGFNWRRVGHADKHEMRWGNATPGYFEAIGAHLLAGRLFDEAHGKDFLSVPPKEAGSGTSVVISRAAAEVLGFSSPQAAIGQSVQEAANDSGSQTYQIIGVIENIRFAGVHSAVRPIVYYGTRRSFSYAGGIIRYSGVSAQQEIARLRATWEVIAPDVAFSAESASDIFASDYRSDAEHGSLFAIGATVAIGIACSGLYGLSAFAISRRRHEIGLRKVMGARTSDILRLLVFDFIRPILIAIAISWPLAWLAMRFWLSGFDQRIEITFKPFLLVTVGAIAIALFTIASQIFRAAQQPPSVILNSSH